MKTVLITGASSGIGEVTAKYLAAQGYRLVLVARNREKLSSLCAELGAGVQSFVYDLNNLENIADIFDYCKEQSLLLHGLVHCAGVGYNEPFRRIDVESVEKTMAINCKSFLMMGKMMALRKYSENGGSIIAISSLSALTAYAGTAAYTISKSALIAACKVLSKEVLNRRIRVNTILPGYVRTPMTAELTEEGIMASDQPWGFIEPEEIAYLIEFLLSDRSRCVTGASIPVSGGMNFC